MNKKYYTITEYGYIASKKSTDYVDKGCALVEEDVFVELENFILRNKDCNTDIETSTFISLSYKKGIGKILKAQNYVGLIQTKAGVTIEILPKIYDDNGKASYEETIKVFLEMLKSLRESPFKKFNLSSLKTSKTNLLDIFISMFLQELGALIKKGIKSTYIESEDNLKYYKGKLDISRNIQHNLVHKEKFYVHYDEFSSNIPENKIIKSTLLYLNKQTTKSSLHKSIREYIFALDEVRPSNNIKADLQRCIADRTMNEYDLILKWCRIFLDNKSFMNYKGNNVAYSLLFPMEKIFESYVAKKIKETEQLEEWDIYTQHNKYYLIEEPKTFKLRPDIVMEKNNNIIVIDTKWKLLNNDSHYNYGISQSDLYQMYAYGKKYKSCNIILIYPLNNSIRDDKENITLTYEEKLKVSIFLWI